jgi:pimeloyl-ACP methyl ester carboxylesterase
VSPTPTPTVAPTPIPTPTPVSKVVFLPGFGGSWNANAFAGCYLDPDPNNWSLASYAENVYDPLLSGLAIAGWDTKPYYYDWRMKIPESIPILSNFITSSSADDEKVNIISHSMGGLLSAGYITENGSDKTNSLMMIGSPLKGVVQSYPAWSGGEIWNDNFIAKIATTLYLKHCGGVASNDRETIRTHIPSMQNLLPVFDYLKYFKTTVFKPWNSMLINHDWFNDNFNFDGIKFGTLSGTGFDTLSEIPIKNRNRRDESLGDWLDGKPAGKTTTTEGDGTVLLSSSFADTSNSSVINQDHSGLVNSFEGINKILEFLGTPPAPTSSVATIATPNSALIIIANPANFWITDQSGKTIKDKNGMISITNPKSGNFKINIIPQSNKTLFVVAQFLPNGQVFYKEYDFQNYLPKFKTVKFDETNPKEDILN